MALQIQPFKNCKKWMPAYIEWGRKLKKCPLFKYNQPKTDIPISIYKMGDPSVKLPISQLFIIPFNFGYLLIINSDLNKWK